MHIRIVTQACGDIPRCQGSRHFARSRAWNQWVEGTERRPLHPRVMAQGELTLLKRWEQGQPFLSVFFFLKKASYIAVWGFSISWKRFREFQDFWLKETQMEMGIKKWMELDSPQIEPIWVSQLTELAPLSQQQRHPGLKFLKTHFFHPRDLFHALPQTDWWETSPLSPYFKLWPFSFCSSWLFIFSLNWDGGNCEAVN